LSDAPEKKRWLCTSTSRPSYRRLPFPDTRAVICKAASSLSRSTARFIEYNGVLCPGRRLRCHGRCGADPREPALFINEHGKRLSYAGLLRRVHRHAGRVTLDVTVTPHTFRRSCATEMIRAGANLYHVKDLLGHETLDTLRHYVKLNVEDIRETLRRCHPRERAEEKAES